MKSKIILLSLLTTLALKSIGQVRLDPFYPYSKWTVGLGMGFTEMYGDLRNSNSEPVYKFHIDRNTNEWVYYGIEVQRGAVSDYDPKERWTNGISAYNQFTNVALNGKISLGELFNHPNNFFAKTLFGLYVGAGVGYMFNNVSSITYKFHNLDKYVITDYSPANINTGQNCVYLPFTVGLNLHMTRRVVFDVNYEMCYAFSDYVDGYSFQAPYAKNNYNDMFSMLTFGLDIYIGKVGVNSGKSSYRTRHN
jgi:hypothetical protein